MKSDYLKIESYLKNAMPPGEREEFEAALKTDATLQKAYILHYLDKEPANDSDMERPNSELINEMRQRLGKLEKPQLNWLDHLRFFLISHGTLKMAALVLAIATLVLVSWVNLSLLSLPQLAQAHFVKPPCLGVAGNDPEIKQLYDNFKQASGYYCATAGDRRAKLEKLAQSCPGFCMAHFYLAHLAFENEDYATAQMGFEQSMQNKDQIVQFSQTRDFGKIKLNLLLSKMAASGDRNEAAATVENLLNDKDCTGEVLESLKKLQKELAHPLRVILLK